MTTPNGNRGVDRRAVLRATGATVLAGSLAGCSGLNVLGEDDDLVLSAPENHDRLQNADLPHPIYGEELPEATVPAPLHDRRVTTTEFVGDRHAMLTFIFTSCTTVCRGLTASLRHVQDEAAELGYGDEIAFQALTFDPEYDTGDVLRSYGEDLGVDYDAGNWYFLRPETPADAREIVAERFGVAFERDDEGAPGAGGDGNDEDGDDEAGGDGGDADDDGDATGGGDGESDGSHRDHQRHFVHSSQILLVNKAGLVERAYTGGPNPGTVVDDARTVLEGW